MSIVTDMLERKWLIRNWFCVFASAAAPLGPVVVLVLFLGQLVMGDTANAQNLFSEDKGAGIDVLDFDFAIATPGLAQIAAWSADSKMLAFPQFNSPFASASAGPWIVDAEHRTISELAKGGGGQSAMAWSPDGKLFAFVPHKAEKLRVLSTVDFSRTASWTADYASFSQCPRIRELIFDDSGNSFWAICRSDGKIDSSGAPTVGALKISYPDFRILHRFTISAPVPGRHTVLKNARFGKIGNRQYLFSIIGSSIGQDKHGKHSFRYYAEADPLDGNDAPAAKIDFEAKDESGTSRSPAWVDFSENFESAVVLYGISMDIAHHPKLDRFFEIYGVKSNTRQLSFGNQSALQCEVRSAAVVPGWKYIVAAASCAESGGLIVFDLHTGEAVQRRMLAATRSLFVSPDSRRIAASAGSGMLFYTVKQKSQ